jgi:hypothetical protein
MQTSYPSTPASSQYIKSCPTDLVGDWQYPHLIIPVSSKSPDKIHGTTYSPVFSDTHCTIFNFDIPTSYTGRTCSVVFLFPVQADLQTSSFTFNDQGTLTFTLLDSIATNSTTWNTAPAEKMGLGALQPKPGVMTVVKNHQCLAGYTASIKVCGSGGIKFKYFQDYNPKPIGVYITSC